MATESGTNNGHVAFTNDVEEGAPVATGPDLSQSEKAWDIDGDGKLDPTELALKEIDKTGKGTLSKDQMYHLMNQNLMVQKDLKKVKKFVIGLVVLTALLALANVGVSFAAAYLAKDTKTVEGKLVVSSSGETVQTDSTTAVFMVDSDLQERVRRERRLQCSGNPVNCNVAHDTPWGLVPKNVGNSIVKKCEQGASVTIAKGYTDANNAVVTKTHQICPPGDATYHANGGMTITKINAPDITVQPVSGENYYAIDGLGALGDTCTETSHEIVNDCGANMKCEKANYDDEFGLCVRSIGHACDDANPCGSSLICDGGICKGDGGHDCKNPNSGLFDDDVVDLCLQPTYSCQAAFTQYGEQGYGVCQCTWGSCGIDGEVCTNSDGCMRLADAPKLCRSQLALTNDCALNQGGGTCHVTDPYEYQCVPEKAQPAEEGEVVKEELVCTEEVYECPYGTTVSRDPAISCAFATCPTSAPACSKDAQLCGTDADGNQVWVGRDPLNGCEFEACPEGLQTKDTVK